MKSSTLRASSKQRRRTIRTPELVAAEGLGVALGRVCIASPDFRADFTAGFTLALKEDSVGRAPNLEAALRAALGAGAKLVDAFITDEPTGGAVSAGDPRSPGDGAAARNSVRAVAPGWGAPAAALRLRARAGFPPTENARDRGTPPHRRRDGSERRVFFFNSFEDRCPNRCSAA